MSEKSKALHGAAAVTEMLDLIGSHYVSDHDIAKVLTEHELDIRALVAFALLELS